MQLKQSFQECLCLMLSGVVIVALFEQPAYARSPKNSGAVAVQALPLSSKQQMSDHTDDLRRLMLQLYTAYPEELAKSTQVGPREMTEWVFDGKANWKFDGIRRLQGMAAIDLALDADFAGDRILALVVGLETLLFAGYGSQNEFEIPPLPDPANMQLLQQQLQALQSRWQHDILPPPWQAAEGRQAVATTLQQLLHRLPQR